MDLGASGSKFTWRGPLYAGAWIFERLYRALSNDSWRISFPEAIVKVLPRLDFSDHHPILISLFRHFHVGGARAFRFESAWQLDKSYNDMLAACWDKNIPVHDNLQALQHNIKEWKFLSFDTVIERKKELMARIGGIQKSMYTGGNLRWLRGLEKKLQSELAEILKKEEMMWFQRSRAKWLMDGDRNTRYYHLKTINRRRYNNVIMLRNDFGEWVEDPVQLQSMVNNFYYDLFSKSNERWEWKQTDVTFPTLDRETFDMLGMPIEDQEVKKALFSMSPWKAPGPDGYPAGFYQQGWNVVGSSII
jgi:hypothetical protein